MEAGLALLSSAPRPTMSPPAVHLLPLSFFACHSTTTACSLPNCSLPNTNAQGGLHPLPGGLRPRCRHHRGGAEATG